MKYPFLKPTIPEISEYVDSLYRIHNKGIFTNHGEHVQELEKAIASKINVSHCMLTCNGTMALMLAVHAVDLVGQVLVPSFTFPATVSVLVWLGLEPVFVDIDPETLTMSTDDIRKKAKGTSAIVPVASFGAPCQIDEIQEIAQSHGLKVIYDSAGAFGAKYKNTTLGGFGNMECFSLHATKIFSTGEGGLITTHDDKLAQKIRRCRNFGFDDFQLVELGINGKMSEFHAAVGLESLMAVDHHIQARTKIVRQYKKRLLKTPIRTQIVNGKSAHQLFPVIAPRRDELMAFLKKKSVETRIYYSPLLNDNDLYRKFKGETPVASALIKDILCLPCYAGADVNKICEWINQFYQKK